MNSKTEAIDSTYKFAISSPTPPVGSLTHRQVCALVQRTPALAGCRSRAFSIPRHRWGTFYGQDIVLWFVSSVLDKRIDERHAGVVVEDCN